MTAMERVVLQAAGKFFHRSTMTGTESPGAVCVLRKAWDDGGDPLVYALVKLAGRVGHRWLFRALLEPLGEIRAENWVDSRLEAGELILELLPSGNGGFRHCWVSLHPRITWNTPLPTAQMWLRKTFKLELPKGIRIVSIRQMAAHVRQKEAFAGRRAPKAKEKEFTCLTV